MSFFIQMMLILRFYARLEGMNEREKQLINKLGKYPQNILFLLISLLICFGIIFSIKTNIISVPFQHKATTVSHKSQIINLNLQNIVFLGSKEESLATRSLQGNCTVEYNPDSSQVELKKLKLETKSIFIKELDKKIKVLDIKQDFSYSSIGKVSTLTGRADLSAGVILEMMVGNSVQKISFVLPLEGQINKSDSSISLSGKATIPPEKLSIPIPFEVLIKGHKI